MTDLLLADRVFLADYNPHTGVKATSPRGAGAKSAAPAVAAAVLVDLISAGSAELQKPRGGLFGGSQPTIVVRGDRPMHPLLGAAFDSIAKQKRPKSVNWFLIWLGPDIGMMAREVALGLAVADPASGSGLRLTEAGLAAAAGSRAELDDWVTRDDLPALSAREQMGLSLPERLSPLRADSLELAAMVRSGAIWPRMWSELPDQRRREIFSQLSVLTSESIALTTRGPEWSAIVSTLQQLNGDFVQ